jgi:hypothetical protein
MASYISSNQNRFYCGIESAYGLAPTIASSNRMSAVKLTARQELDLAARKDKTGSRTFAGTPAGARKKTTFAIKTYLGAWAGGTSQPGCGPLVQAALGAAPVSSPGGSISNNTNSTQLSFASPHGLVANQAVSFNGEIRFVASVVDTQNIITNAPFTTAPTSGAQLTPTVTYNPATNLPSVSIFDYWSPVSALQRVLVGAAVNTMSVTINGDYQEFEFQGIAQDILDSSSFASGQGGMNAFPSEPTLSAFDLTVVPGNLGQAWLGASSQQYSTVTAATLQLGNTLDERDQEFGSSVPLAVAPGDRTVALNLSLFEQDDAGTQGLYQAARQRSPISVMLQLGQATGQLCGIYLNSVIPELPEFDDSSTRLQWKFTKSRAQGTVDNEISVAFA